MHPLSFRAFVGIAVAGVLCSCAFTVPVLAIVRFPGELDEDPDELAGRFGFANVGTIGSATGVYLGDGWVLTAKHIGAGSFVLGGVTYCYEEGSARSIENPTGHAKLRSTYTDLTLFKIVGRPDLPSLTIAAEPPSVCMELFLAGNGIKYRETLSYWNVDTGDWVWTESEEVTPFWGFKPASGSVLSWGKNKVIASYNGPGPSTHYLSVNGADMVAIKTRFDAKEPYEAQAVSGDSGGGAFYWDENSRGWVLAGIISCVEEYPNAPSQAIVNATTCCVDLSFYRDQILDIIAPEPEPDIPGDANHDGVVDGSDATILSSYWQQTTTEGSRVGDFNNDGIVDGSDATILAGNWNYACPTEAISAARLPMTEAPEPDAWVLLLTLVVLAFSRRACSAILSAAYPK